MKNSVQAYLTIYSDKLIDNRTSKHLTYLARGTSENFKIFLPLMLIQSLHHSPHTLLQSTCDDSYKIT